MYSHPLQVGSFIYFWGRNSYFPELESQADAGGNSAFDGLHADSNCLKQFHLPSRTTITPLLPPEFLPPDGNTFQMVALQLLTVPSDQQPHEPLPSFMMGAITSPRRPVTLPGEWTCHITFNPTTRYTFCASSFGSSQGTVSPQAPALWLMAAWDALTGAFSLVCLIGTKEKCCTGPRTPCTSPSSSQSLKGERHLV